MASVGAVRLPSRGWARHGSGIGSRISRAAARPLVVVAVFAFLYLSFGVSNLRHLHALNGVEEQVAKVRTVLGSELEDQLQLETLLGSTQDQLQVMRQVVVHPLPDTAVLEAVLASAATSEVSVTSVIVESPVVEELGAHAFRASPYGLKVDGELDRVLDFLARLETATLETLAVRRVSLSSSEKTTVASVNFSVYSQTPSSSPEPGIPNGGSLTEASTGGPQ